MAGDCGLRPKSIILAMAVFSLAACNPDAPDPVAPDPVAPDPVVPVPGPAPCPPSCILTVYAPAHVEIGRSVQVDARVANLRNDPVSGVAVQWSLGLHLDWCTRCNPPLYMDMSEIAPSASVTGADGRVVGTLVIPAEGTWRLKARFFEGEDSAVAYAGLVGRYPAASWQVEWTSLRPMRGGFDRVTAVQIGPRIFLMEGYCNFTEHQSLCPRPWPPLRFTDIYDIDTDSWSVGAPPPLSLGPPVSGVARGGATLNGVVHLVRGLEHYAYDPAADLWTERTAPPATASHARLEATAGRLFLIGTGGNRRDVYVYDPVTDAWGAAAPRSSDAVLWASAVVGGLIYVAGRSVMERYNPATDSWDTLPPMPLPRSEFAAGAVGQLFCVFGGSAGGLRFRETYCYDTAAGSWSLGPPMPWSGVNRVGAAGEGHDVFAFGGSYEWGGGGIPIGEVQVASAARLSAR
jgi:hypothetical protein